MKAKKESKHLTVYYDGLCHLCHSEIEMYRKRDQHGVISFIDISSKGFDAESEGLNPENVQKLFHVRDEHGNLLTGVDGFAAIWDRLNIFRPLSKLSKHKLSRPIFDLGYWGFSKIRPLLPRRHCADGSCRI